MLRDDVVDKVGSDAVNFPELGYAFLNAALDAAPVVESFSVARSGRRFELTLHCAATTRPPS